jgi:hypothetical protein
MNKWMRCGGGWLEGGLIKMAAPQRFPRNPTPDFCECFCVMDEWRGNNLRRDCYCQVEILLSMLNPFPANMP